MEIIPANFDDIPDLVALVQSCYRGESSRKGWTTEEDILEGPRCTPATMKEEMERPGAVILKCVQNSEIIGCAYTELQKDKMYTGMLCVRPDLQAAGLGKKIMTVVDDMARKQNCTAVKMHVIAQRKELVEWYERKGFKRTGETAPFPTGEGQPIQKIPLHFVVLQREL